MNDVTTKNSARTSVQGVSSNTKSSAAFSEPLLSRCDVIKLGNVKTSLNAWNQSINNPDVNTFMVMPHRQPVWSSLETQNRLNVIPHVMDLNMNPFLNQCSAMLDEAKRSVGKQRLRQRWDEHSTQTHHRPYSPRVKDRSANRHRSSGNRNSEETNNYRRTFQPVVIQTQVTPKSEVIESDSAFFDTTGSSNSEQVSFVFGDTDRLPQWGDGHLAHAAHQSYSSAVYVRSADEDRSSEKKRKETYQQTINYGRAFQAVDLRTLATPRSQDISGYASFTTATTNHFNSDHLQTRSMNTLPQIRSDYLQNVMSLEDQEQARPTAGRAVAARPAVARPAAVAEVFLCVKCKKCLSCESSLRRHMMTHEDVVHACQLCGKEYTRTDSVLRHQKKYHPS